MALSTLQARHLQRQDEQLWMILGTYRVLQKRKNAKRRYRWWVHEILKRSNEQGAYHNLIMELELFTLLIWDRIFLFLRHVVVPVQWKSPASDVAWRKFLGRLPSVCVENRCPIRLKEVGFAFTCAISLVYVHIDQGLSYLWILILVVYPLAYAYGFPALYGIKIGSHMHVCICVCGYVKYQNPKIKREGCVCVYAWYSNTLKSYATRRMT